MTLLEQGDEIAAELASVLTPRPVLARYVARPPVECCDGCGTLVWWPGPIRPQDEDEWACPGPAVARLFFRLAMCWPTLNDDGSFPDDKAAPITIAMIDALSLMSKRIIELICSGGTLRNMRLIGGTTQQPEGGCVTSIVEVEIVVS